MEYSLATTFVKLPMHMAVDGSCKKGAGCSSVAFIFCLLSQPNSSHEDNGYAVATIYMIICNEEKEFVSPIPKVRTVHTVSAEDMIVVSWKKIAFVDKRL